ncbi:hypothetical protein [Psychrosphaera ytuae]|uniref:hypothetical protein n=1 Tax=Psychrosphaera ytuae TaxID=2820710 RepID=UPI001E3712AD|nr:hypothetical protein [Psychrosphaera ytuae]
MFKRQNFDKKRSHRSGFRQRRGGIKDELINRQVLVIHRAIAEKMLKAHQAGDDSLRQKVLETISTRYDLGKMRYGEYLTWQSVLELLDSPEDFVKGIMEDSPQMNKYRRRTPFVGILTEDERQRVLTQDALGSIDDVAILF